ncbi:MAG: 30S ribosomal protein S4 [Candidatus Pacebacteria bacterium]|nr:30S ribosomal protein S4 [Candidatus Paceibacterota bacterium]
MIKQSKCKICRRLGEKLFLKGDRCFSAKCSMIKRPYAPGQKPKKRKAGLSEYGRELREKQRIKKWYNLTEQEFKAYVTNLLEKKSSDVASAFAGQIETRLDNIIFRLGLAKSRAEARQMVTHGHFNVNGRRTDIPSRILKIGDKIAIRHGSKEKATFKNIEEKIKKAQIPTWLSLDKKTLEAEVKKYPTIEDIQLPGELSSVFEHYSR